MKKIGLRLLVLTLFLFTVFVGNASAEVRPGAFTISPMAGGYGFDDDQDLLDLGKTFTLGLGYNFTKNLATELAFSYIHTDADGSFTDDDVYVYQPRIDLLYHILPDKMIVPYVALGVGGMMFDDDNIAPRELDDMFQANAGGGLKLFVSEDVALRADARYYHGFEDSQSEYALTLGMVFQLGGEREPKPCMDRDGDGVCDDEDQCPDTPEGARVDTVGCQVKSEPYAVMEKSGETGQAMDESDTVVVVEEAIEMMEVVVYFDFDETTVKPLYFERLADLAAFMDENPDIVAVVEGHTDSVGSDSYNMALSKSRAEAIQNYMVNNHGIDADRFDLKWFGEERPVAPNDTDSNRQLNRRAITITVME